MFGVGGVYVCVCVCLCVVGVANPHQCLFCCTRQAQKASAQGRSDRGVVAAGPHNNRILDLMKMFQVAIKIPRYQYLNIGESELC